MIGVEIGMQEKSSQKYEHLETKSMSMDFLGRGNSLAMKEFCEKDVFAQTKR